MSWFAWDDAVVLIKFIALFLRSKCLRVWMVNFMVLLSTTCPWTVSYSTSLLCSMLCSSCQKSVWNKTNRSLILQSLHFIGAVGLWLHSLSPGAPCGALAGHGTVSTGPAAVFSLSCEGGGNHRAGFTLSLSSGSLPRLYDRSVSSSSSIFSSQCPVSFFSVTATGMTPVTFTPGAELLVMSDVWSV